METRKIEVTQPAIPAKTYDKFTYVSVDGKEFEREKDCLAYELELRNKEIAKTIYQTTFYNDIPDPESGQWYLCKDQDEIEFVFNYWYKGEYVKYKESAKPNEMFLVQYKEEYANGRDYNHYRVYSLEGIMKNIEEFKKWAEEQNDKNIHEES
jgi:hypothetical protein